MKVLQVVATIIFTSVMINSNVCRATEQVCCPSIDCFTKDSPFDDIPLPKCPEEMDINMRLYTPDDATDGQVINRTTIPSTFDGSRLTIYVTHGWLQSEKSLWLGLTKDALLEKCNCNVIIVGWSGGSQTGYFQSSSNTRTVGAEIALVANKTINEAGSDQSRIYCVGHSLGAHVCGHAGQRRKFGRITGLDAAGPWFDRKDWTCGLNPSCADRVEVIHTNGQPCPPMPIPLGTLKELGHIDFYPNGGGGQPGCPLSVLTIPLSELLALDYYVQEHNMDVAIGCCHQRAVDYYLESIRNPCFLSRYYCSAGDSTCQPKLNTNDLLKVPSIIQSMGFKSIDYSNQGKFYLETNSESPFCRS